jgi:CRP-like cAMP-binding protein
MEIIRIGDVRRYVLRRPQFWIDCASSFPIHIFCRTREEPGLPYEVNFIKVIRLYSMIKNKYDDHYSTVVTADGNELFNLWFTLAFLGHMLACVWVFIVYGTSDGFDRNDMFADSIGSPVLGIWAYAYKCGIYLVLGNDLFGMSPQENLLYSFFAPVGTLGMSAVVSQMVVLLSRRQALASGNKERKDRTRQAMESLRLPATLKMRILSYMTYEQVHRRLQNSLHDSFSGIGDTLQFELRIVMYLDLLLHVPLFKEANSAMIRDLIGFLQDVIVLPGDFVVHMNEEGDSMYFVSRGALSIIGINGDCLKSLEVGGFFGEVSLISGKRRTAHVRAETFCTLAVLDKLSFEGVMLRHPEQLELIISNMSTQQKRWITDMAKNDSDSSSEEDSHRYFLQWSSCMVSNYFPMTTLRFRVRLKFCLRSHD